MFTFVYVAVMVIIHYFVWKPKYETMEISEEQRKAKIEMVRANLALSEEDKKRIRISRMR